MKKSVLFLSLLLLFGCGDVTYSSERNNRLSIFDNLFPSSEESTSSSDNSTSSSEESVSSSSNLTSSSEESTSSSSSSTSSSEESTSSSDKINSEEKILNVDLTNDSIAVNLEQNSTEKERAKSLFGDLLNDLSFSKVFLDLGALKLGGRNQDDYGNFTLTFNNQITKIEVEVKPYTKLYGTTNYNCDKPIFKINDNEIELTKYTSGLSTYETHSVDINSNVVKLESYSGRTIIGKMKIFYVEQ